MYNVLHFKNDPGACSDFIAAPLHTEGWAFTLTVFNWMSTCSPYRGLMWPLYWPEHLDRHKVSIALCIDFLASVMDSVTKNVHFVCVCVCVCSLTNTNQPYIENSPWYRQETYMTLGFVLVSYGTFRNSPSISLNSVLTIPTGEFMSFPEKSSLGQAINSGLHPFRGLRHYHQIF